MPGYDSDSGFETDFGSRQRYQVSMEHETRQGMLLADSFECTGVQVYLSQFASQTCTLLLASGGGLNLETLVGTSNYVSISRYVYACVDGLQLKNLQV